MREMGGQNDESIFTHAGNGRTALRWAWVAERYAAKLRFMECQWRADEPVVTRHSRNARNSALNRYIPRGISPRRSARQIQTLVQSVDALAGADRTAYAATGQVEGRTTVTVNSQLGNDQFVNLADWLGWGLCLPAKRK